MRDVVVVGGGLAGLAAMAALTGEGVGVTLVEWRPYVGGRAYSYELPAVGEVIDSQHVVLGCCTNVVEMMERAGGAEAIRWFDAIVFVEPGGRRSVLQPSGMPAPMQQTMSLLRAPMLGLRDKVGISRGLMEFMRGYPGDDTESVRSWMERTGQTERAIRHFWEPIILATLNDSFERCSLKYAGKVFHEAFLKSAAAGRMGIPNRPLSEFYQPVSRRAEEQGAEVRLRTTVEGLERNGAEWRVRLAGGEVLEAAAVVLATDFRRTRELLAGAGVGEAVQADALRMEVAPITGIHLWFDREFTEDVHAALLDTRVQWMFNKSRIREWGPERGSYLELVISGSFAELKMGREAILENALRELRTLYPAMAGARLVKSTVLKEARATFSVAPGMDAARPTQRTGVPGLFVAGDWTKTEWPSTMEGAVRSGRLAAGEVCGERERFMAPELPAGGLMRWVAE